MRINRFIAACKGISRRKADEFIKAGRVSVNGSPVNSFIDVDPDKDTVELDGETLKFESNRVYFAFYKPTRVLSSHSDPEGRATVCDFFRDVDTKKLICVGRLDYMSEGLLIVTNDGEFANLMMHPKFKIRKVYLVKTEEALPGKLLKKMEKGVVLEDGFFKPLKVEKTSNPHWLLVAIDTGRNRILRRFFKYFDIPILKLKRIAIGDIELGDLKEGSYKTISDELIRKLKKRARSAIGRTGSNSVNPG